MSIRKLFKYLSFLMSILFDLKLRCWYNPFQFAGCLKLKARSGQTEAEEIVTEATTGAEQTREWFPAADNIAIITKLTKRQRPDATNTGPLIQAAMNGSKGILTMTSISKFDSSVYSEETMTVTEAEYDEVMQLMADESSEFEGYAEWSASLESAVVNESANFIATADGKVYHKPEPKSAGRIGGIEI
jgi:hypothetical protein